jgi:hypothetical protein
MELSDAIVSRCEAAQKFDQVERYNEHLAGEKRTWLFFPAGDLDRRLELERTGEKRGRLASPKVSYQSRARRANEGSYAIAVNKNRFQTKTVPLPRTILPPRNQTYPDAQLETSNGPQRRL